MKEQIGTLYSNYGRYINKYRSFPLVHDGLKIVERRLLYSLYEKAKDHFVKSAEVVGHCIGQYHPHGDASAYGSLVALVNGGMAKGQGNWGCSSGIVPCEAAANRYTEVRAAKEILDMAFEYIKYIPMEALEIYSEPVYIPTKLPLCLVNRNYCQGIGFGHRTYIPSYKTSDLVKRLNWLLTKEGKEPIIKPITDCLYISKDKDFQELLTTGKGKIEYRGVSELDYSNKSVIVKAIPPNKSFQRILGALENDIQIQKSIGFIDESTKTTKVRFTALKRGMTIEQLAKKINVHLVGSITFDCNMCDTEGNVVTVSIDQMLLNVYNSYKAIVSKVLLDTIAKLQSDIDELNMIAKIKLVLPKWLKQHPDDSDLLIAGINTDTHIPIETIDKLFDKYTIKRILKIRTDIQELEQKKIGNQNNFNNLDSYVWTDKYSALAT